MPSAGEKHEELYLPKETVMISRPVRTAVRGEQGEEMSEGQLIMEGPPPPHRTSSARGSDPSQAVLPLNLNASFSKEWLL